jgi:hypothetical protein
MVRNWPGASGVPIRDRLTPVAPNPISERIEGMAQAIAERVVNLVMDAIDIDALLDGIDVDRIIDRVDVEKIIERVDVERIVERVNVDRIVERVDVEKIINRVDVNSVVERVDVGRIVDQLDIDSLVEQTELGSIIAKSTTGVASEVLDVIRAQGVGLDDFFARWANRLLRRNMADLPLGPPTLVAADVPGPGDPAGPSDVAAPGARP